MNKEEILYVLMQLVEQLGRILIFCFLLGAGIWMTIYNTTNTKAKKQLNDETDEHLGI